MTPDPETAPATPVAALPAGLLPDIARALDVTEAVAGQTVTVYALATAVSAIPLSVALRRWNRRTVLVTALAAFVVANLVIAVTDDFAVVLAGFVVPGAPAEVDAALAASRPAVFYGRGDVDQVIPLDAVERTSAWLAEHADVEESVYPGLAHGISQEELDDVNAFLGRVHPA